MIQRRRAIDKRLTLLLVLLLATALNAQTGTAHVAGWVEDASGARIPNAAVKLINVLTGMENRFETGSDGAFYLAGMLPGTYTLQIERDGFATAQVTGLAIGAGETKNLLIRLRVGVVTETIEIDAAAITLKADSAAMQTVIDRKLAAHIPVNGRSFQDLITMTPGVLTQSPQAMTGAVSTNGSVSVNGQRTDANYFSVDGVSGNFGAADLSGARKIPSDGSQPGLTAIGTTQSLASFDALEEFRVLSSNYSAEYGTAPGGQFTIATRAGNDAGKRAIHGNIYNSRRDSFYDGQDWFVSFDTGTAPWNEGYTINIPYHQDDFGGTLSIPLVLPHTRTETPQTFLFASFEAVHLSQPSPYLVQYLPSYRLIESAPEELQPLLRDFPDVGYEDSSEALLGSVNFSPLPGRISASSGRLDHAFSSKVTSFFRYNFSPSDSTGVNLSTSSRFYGTVRTATLGIMAQLSPTRSNDLRLGYGKDQQRIYTYLSYAPYSWGTFTAYSDMLTNLGVPASEASARGEAYIHIPGIGESMIDVDQASSALRQWNLRDIFSLQAGRHFFRFGADYRHMVSNVTPAALSVEADFFDENALLTNRANDIAITRTDPATPIFTEFSAFAQDEWKATKRLTLSPGLRWEVNPAPHGKDGADAYTLRGSLASPATLRLAPRGTPLWQTSWLNVAPRFGIAWSANERFGWETVLRAGAGIYFGTDNRAAAEAFNAIGFSATNHPENVPVPITAEQLDFTTKPAAPYTDTLAIAFPHHFQLPYAFQWNIAVDQALGKNQTLNAAWVGAAGHRLLEEQRVNINAGNPEFGEVSYFPAGVTSNYQSLQIKFQRPLAPGIQALASYVWSHAFDYGSTAPEFPLVYGNSVLDVRHNLQAMASWQQRPLHGNWAMRTLVSGWGIDGRVTARTGFPVTLLGNLFSDAATGDRYYGGVNRVAGQPLYLHGAQYPGGQAINGGPDAASPAFALPDGDAPGNAPRNLVRGLGEYQVNAAVSHEFHFFDWMNLNLRAEGFNVFNHPNLGYVDPVLSNQLFGQATLLLNQSLGSNDPLYQPGTPRSLQFSAQIHF